MYIHKGALATTNIFINYEWAVGLFDVQCYGNETTLWDCMYNTVNKQSCTQYNDASVFCLCKSFSVLTQY